MNGRPGKLGVTPAARLLVGVATATLPSGAVRERYRREHLGELRAVSRGGQVNYAAGALATSWALRRAVLEGNDMSTTTKRPGKPLLCRLNLHHAWRPESTEDGGRYRRCARCGKDDVGPPPRGIPHRPMPWG
ncbi:MAG TPA: hypothetical protein VES95_11365 [Dermatophilaceae bacterium]|nr:hypothetical protein [Dermatophilaceae bacterium]